jgi:ribosomal protein S18 acetylase RimI-like enzyme
MAASFGQGSLAQPQIALRPTRTEDDSFLRQVYASTRMEEMALVDWSEGQKEAFLSMQFDAQDRYYREHFETAQFQIIELEGRPIGRLYVDRTENEILVIDIALLPQQRNAGIGNALLRDLLAEAANSGKTVRIHVERFNPALRLYRRLGFSEVAEEGLYLLMEWRAVR